ncbi:MAG: hypothetical protein KAX80_07700 [Planctomycetes bacterium]|nr:hypothetical protein [Planctomycetota bacterium]
MGGETTALEKAFGLVHATLMAEWQELLRLEDYECAEQPEKAVELFGDLQDLADTVAQALAKLKDVHATISWLANEIAERSDGTPPAGE